MRSLLIRLICTQFLGGVLLHTGLAEAADPATGLKTRLIFPLHPQHNHAPGIAELPGGELIASWYRGSGERSADDVAVYGARLAPGASEWGPTFLMVDTPGFPDCNTCLRVDQQGQLHLYWPLVLANSWESCLTQYRIAANPKGTGAPDWTAAGQILLKPADFQEPLLQHLDELLVKLPRPLTPREEQELAELRSRAGEKLYQRLGWQPRCKPTVLKTGRVLLPLYSDTYSISIMAISDDNGATWRASQPLLGLGAIQPAVLERRDGTLVAYMRENGFTGRVRVCESTDGGETWGPVGLSELLNPGSGLDGVVLDSGHWLLVYNDLPQGRNSLAVSLSTDEGRSWQFTRHLERADAGSFHYPTVIQGADGTIHCVYSYFVTGGKSMKHASFPEDWLRQAPASSK